jgi:hypothetical protein
MIEGSCLNVGCGSHIIEHAVNIDEGLPELPYEDGSFDTVICSDVLEHIKPHREAIDELFRVARRKVIITVPAYQWLYGTYDKLLRHRRRYYAKDFPGFSVKYLFWFLVPIIFLRKTFNMKHRPLPKAVDDLFFRLSKVRLNFGTTILAVKYKNAYKEEKQKGE